MTPAAPPQPAATTALASVLALDLARVTGWAEAAAADAAAPRVGALELGDTDAHEIALTRALRAWLLGRLPSLAHGAGLVVYERPVAYTARRAGWQRTSYLEHELLDACERWGVPSINVDPSRLKKHATGSGRADKDEVRAAVARRWPGLADELLALPLDASDALAVLGWALDDLALGAATGGEQGIDPVRVLGVRRRSGRRAEEQAQEGAA